jgi:hypothetical protein
MPGIARLFCWRHYLRAIDHPQQEVDERAGPQRVFATMNSVREGKRIWYGVIDGDDTNRLMAA